MSANTSWKDQHIAYALLRVVAGTNIMMHGVSRMIAGRAGFASHMSDQFAHSPLPQGLVYLFGSTLPFVEAGIGALLLIGWKTRGALMGALLLMLVLTFGSTMIQDWSAASIQLTYAAIFAGLLGLRHFNAWCIDGQSEQHSL